MSSQGSPQTPAALQILVVEGLHPFHDERVRKLMDFHIYLDISDEVKEAWKIQRDSQERGHSEESIRASIAARKPDFDTFIDPQKKHADVIIQVPCSAWPCPAAPAAPLRVVPLLHAGVLACVLVLPAGFGGGA